MNSTVLDNLQLVARALTEVEAGEFVFVGGAAVALLVTDPGAPRPRFTVDVDVVTRVQTRSAYYALEARLRKAGYSQVPEGPICRWNVGGVQVDIMPMDAAILGFSNQWYPQLMEHPREHVLPDGTRILVASPPHLVASKLEAFQQRGARDPRLSQDLEDVIILFDGRPALVEEVAAAPPDVHGWIAGTLRNLLGDSAFRESLSGHLPPDSASQARAPELLRRLSRVAEGTS